VADPPLRPAPGLPFHLVACVRAEEVGALPPGVLLQEAGQEPASGGVSPRVDGGSGASPVN